MEIARRYKIRKIVTKNATGEVFGITLPRSAVNNLLDVEFQVIRKKGDIILKSGCSREWLEFYG